MHFKYLFIVDKDITGDTRIVSTEYLAQCLYNQPSNLMILNVKNNTVKSNKEFIAWLDESKLINVIKKDILEYPDMTQLENCFDRSGFILRFNHSSHVKDKYHGFGFAEALCAYLLRKSTFSKNPEESINYHKSIAIRRTFDHYIEEDLENEDKFDSKFDYEVLDEAIEVLSALSIKFAKKVGEGDFKIETRSHYIKLFKDIIREYNLPTIRVSSASSSLKPSREVSGYASDSELQAHIKELELIISDMKTSSLKTNLIINQLDTEKEALIAENKSLIAKNLKLKTELNELL